MKALAILLMFVGVIWALTVGWMYLVLSGIMEPISAVAVLSNFGAMLIGPILLLVGPILVLAGSQPKLGAWLAIIGCVILTGIVGYNAAGDLCIEPLQAKPPYLFDVSLFVVTMLVDIGALRMYQLVSFRRAMGA